MSNQAPSMIHQETYCHAIRDRSQRRFAQKRRVWLFVVVLSCLCWLWTDVAQAAPPVPTLVADLNQTTDRANSHPQHLLAVGDSLYFFACHDMYACGIWRSTGAISETTLLFPIEGILQLLLVKDNAVYFSTYQYDSVDIWKWDGTQPTRLLQLPNQGRPPTLVGLAEVYTLGSAIYFLGGSPTMLWKYDGGVATAIADRPYWQTLYVLNNRLYFVTYNQDAEEQFWEYDGNTSRQIQIGTDARITTIRHVHLWQNQIYFVTNASPLSASQADRLWQFDGTNATEIASASNEPYGFQEWMEANNRLYFRVNVSPTPCCPYSELWFIENGMAQKVSFDPALDLTGTRFDLLCFYNQQIYFHVYRNDKVELWQHNGVLTKQVPLPVNVQVSYNDITPFNNAIYILDSGRNLWKYDGSLSTPITIAHNLQVAPVIVATDEKLYFTAYDPTYPTEYDQHELWQYDGQTAKRLLSVKKGGDIAPALSKAIDQLTPVGQQLFFVALTTDKELWVVRNRQVVKLNLAYATHSEPYPFITTPNKLYFHAYDSAQRRTWLYQDNQLLPVNFQGPAANPDESSITAWVYSPAQDVIYFSRIEPNATQQLWQLKGTIVSPIDLTATTSNSPGCLKQVQNNLYFHVTSLDAQENLWSYDGKSLQPLQLLPPMPPLSQTVDLCSLVTLGQKSYFLAADQHRKTLWMRDEITVTQLLPAQNQSNDWQSLNLTVLGGKLYIVAADGYALINGDLTPIDIELWVYDGTALHKIDINTNNDLYQGSSGPHFLTQVDRSLYFVAIDSTDTRSIWKLDGLQATKIDLPPSKRPFPDRLTAVGDALYFTMYDSDGILQLWKHHAQTLAKVSLPADVSIGFSPLVAFGDTLFFTAIDKEHGEELWYTQIDQTTVTCIDIFPGSRSARPASLNIVGNRLLFSAQGDIETGVELWAIDLSLPNHVFLPVVLEND